METSETNASSNTDPSNRDNAIQRILGVLLAVMALFCAAVMIRIMLIGWGNSLLDMHGFRQTQTAISSYYMQRGSGGLFNYETPVLGYPWEVPFEFPLYQVIVSTVSKLLHLPLAQTGRAVSECFWIATVGIIWLLLGELKVRPVFRTVFLILLLVSPEYLFWSRTFTIESTVLCISTAYLLFVLRYLRLRHPRELILGTVFGVLAALVKITTLPAFALLAFVACIAAIYRSVESPRTPIMVLKAALRETIPLFLLLAAPVLAGAAWTAYTDSIRARNPIGNPHLLSSSLRDWTFGTLSQRFDKETWKVIVNERVRDAVGSLRLPILAALCFAVTRLRWKEGLLALIAYLTPFLLFTNLFFVHNYYAYANSLFLACFVGFGIVSLLEKRHVVMQGVAIVLLGYAVYVTLQRYELAYRRAQEFDNVEVTSVGRAIRDHTNPDELLVAAGLDWSPEVPFYAERRSLLLPEWVTAAERDKVTASISAAVDNLSPRKVGAVAVCRAARTNVTVVDTLRARFGLRSKPVFTNNMCDVYDLDPNTPAVNPAK